MEVLGHLFFLHSYILLENKTLVVRAGHKFCEMCDLLPKELVRIILHYLGSFDTLRVYLQLKKYPDNQFYLLAEEMLKSHPVKAALDLTRRDQCLVGEDLQSIRRLFSGDNFPVSKPWGKYLLPFASMLQLTDGKVSEFWKLWKFIRFGFTDEVYTTDQVAAAKKMIYWVAENVGIAEQKNCRNYHSSSRKKEKRKSQAKCLFDHCLFPALTTVYADHNADQHEENFAACQKILLEVLKYYELYVYKRFSMISFDSLSGWTLVRSETVDRKNLFANLLLSQIPEGGFGTFDIVNLLTFCVHTRDGGLRKIYNCAVQHDGQEDIANEWHEFTPHFDDEDEESYEEE